MTITRIAQLTGQETEPVTLAGWVRSARCQKNIAFIVLNDGSNQAGIQVVIAPQCSQFSLVADAIQTGASLSVVGTIQASSGRQQTFELVAQTLTLLGGVAHDYPLQKKWHSLDFLRTLPALRGRTNTFGIVHRIRNTLIQAAHTMLDANAFLWVPTPILSASDCEGAGELFEVTSSARPNFFGQPTFLSVSGQLHAEALATAMGRVYTFGPTFRAENSQTSRHLSEFWMLEPEMAFVRAEACSLWAQRLIQTMLQAVLKRNEEDLLFLESRAEKPLCELLHQWATQSFTRITYTHALEELSQCPNLTPLTWGDDLQAEHERALCEKVVQGPLIITDYPATLKAFYMRLNQDEKTVAAFDIVMPQLGELVGGSEREERLEYLDMAMAQRKIDPAPLTWYRNLRRYGTVPHSGFGLGFERLVKLVTGLENIKDAIPFPRYPDHCND